MNSFINAFSIFVVKSTDSPPVQSAAVPRASVKVQSMGEGDVCTRKGDDMVSSSSSSSFSSMARGTNSILLINPVLYKKTSNKDLSFPASTLNKFPRLKASSPRSSSKLSSLLMMTNYMLNTLLHSTLTQPQWMLSYQMHLLSNRVCPILSHEMIRRSPEFFVCFRHPSEF